MKNVIGLLLIGWFIIPSAQAEENALGSDVQGLLNYAREHNPELSVVRYEAEASWQRVQPAGAFPDPVLRTELMDFTNQAKNKDPSLFPSQVGETRYTLMQSVPWFGKRDLQREVAESRAYLSDGQATATWAELASQIKSGYAQYYYLTESEQLFFETRDLMANLEQIAQARYANGLSPQQDVLRAQIGQADLSGELISTADKLHHVRSRLNALLSRPVMSELAQPILPRYLPASSKLDFRVLEHKLLENNPQLRITEAGVQVAKQSRELSYLDRYPDFTLGIAPTQSGNTLQSWNLMVEFNIPLQQEARRAREYEADSMLLSAGARQEALRNEILAGLSSNLSALNAARNTKSLIDTRLLPQATMTYESALTSYQNGKVDFATLLDAQKQIIKAKQQQLNAQLDAQLRLAEIERLLGEEL